MKSMKENTADMVILILLIAWGIYEIFMIPFLYDTIVSIFVGVSLVCLFPWACNTTKVEYLKIRNMALRYSVTFMITLFCSLKIVGVLREKTFDVDGIKVIFIGVFLQSAYFLIVKHQRLKKHER